MMYPHFLFERYTLRPTRQIPVRRHHNGPWPERQLRPDLNRCGRATADRANSRFGLLARAILMELWDHGGHEYQCRSSPREELESAAVAAAVPPALSGNDGGCFGRL